MQLVDFRTMGCAARVVVTDDTPAARDELHEARSWLEDRERELSRFLPTSALVKLNREGFGVVGQDLFDAIGAALSAAAATSGLVTPTILPALEALGYDRTFEAITDDESMPIRSFGPVADRRSVQCDPSTRTVRLAPGTRLDLGGTAKGWCADRAVRRLGRRGPALVDLGGDIAVLGAPSGGWPVAIADPRVADATLGTVSVRSGGIATSGRDYRVWRRSGVAQHHIVDPRTSLATRTDVLSATVLATSALTAEVAAKLVVIVGSAHAMTWLSKARLAALVVLDDGRVLQTDRLADYFFEGST